jgi:hypothetical protein
MIAPPSVFVAGRAIPIGQGMSARSILAHDRIESIGMFGEIEM